MKWGGGDGTGHKRVGKKCRAADRIGWLCVGGRTITMGTRGTNTKIHEAGRVCLDVRLHGCVYKHIECAWHLLIRASSLAHAETKLSRNSAVLLSGYFCTCGHHFSPVERLGRNRKIDIVERCGVIASRERNFVVTRQFWACSIHIHVAVFFNIPGSVFVLHHYIPIVIFAFVPFVFTSLGEEVLSDLVIQRHLYLPTTSSTG